MATKLFQLENMHELQNPNYIYEIKGDSISKPNYKKSIVNQIESTRTHKSRSRFTELKHPISKNQSSQAKEVSFLINPRKED